VISAIGAYYGFSLAGEDKRAFMPGKLSYSHHQIELACGSCHGAAFSSRADMEKRCHDCHGKELQTMEDSHGSKKFGDPRNAKWLKVMDAKKCLSCHQEHVPERTSAMTLSQPKDFCAACHMDVEKDRPDHRGIAATTCTNAGCHHYHDNRDLNEDFITAHLNQPDTKKDARRTTRARSIKKPLKPDMNTDSEHASKFADIVTQWQGSLHASGHANCSDCHKEGRSWSVDLAVCKHCHEEPIAQWTQGHHGMRFAVDKKLITVNDSALPMREDAHAKALNCNSCHQPHGYNTVKAESEACLGCHADDHSLAWKQSRHAQLWQQNPDAGASCATCHMPHMMGTEKNTVIVQHNISMMMRPEEKMLQAVCMTCHGFDFSLRALSDPALIKNNFSAMPPKSHQSIDWVQARKSSEAANKPEQK